MMGRRALIITRAAATGVDAAPNIVDAAPCWRRHHHHLLASSRPEIGSARQRALAVAAVAAAAGISDEPATEHCHVSNQLHFQLDTVAADLTGGYVGQE